MSPSYWNSIGLEMIWHKQVTHTQRHMNNAWSEMVFSTACLALYWSWSFRLLQTIWDNSSPITDQPCRLITTLLLLVLHLYDYKQPYAPPSTLAPSPTILAPMAMFCRYYPHPPPPCAPTSLPFDIYVQVTRMRC